MLFCQVCSAEFEYLGPKGRNYKASTCSKECRYKLTGMKTSERRIHPVIVSKCEICGTETTNSKTCSRECHFKRLSSLYSGRKLTDEWKENQSRAKSRENVVKYGNYECEKCNKRFETNLSLRAHTSYCNQKSQTTAASCAECGKSFDSERGLKIHLHSHDDGWRESKQKKLKLKAQSRTSQSTSKSEIAFYEKLVKFFGEQDVVHKFKIPDCAHEYDFYVKSKNLIVEFDGDYWHGNKAIHALTPRMKMQYRLDRAWDEKAVLGGYGIKRVWESESRNFEMEKL